MRRRTPPGNVPQAGSVEAGEVVAPLDDRIAWVAERVGRGAEAAHEQRRQSRGVAGVVVEPPPVARVPHGLVDQAIGRPWQPRPGPIALPDATRQVVERDVVLPYNRQRLRATSRGR